MARFDFQSPGAAFTDQITQVLAERKAEERQKMLDSLTMAAEQRAAQQMEQDQMWRQEQLAQQRRQEQMQRLGVIAGNMQMGDDPTSRGLGEHDIDMGRQLGMWTEQAAPPVPSVSTEETYQTQDGEDIGASVEPGMPQQPVEQQSRLGFVGTEKERDRERRKYENAQLVTRMMGSGDPQDVEIAESLARVANANDGEIPDQLLSMLIPRHVRIFDEQGGQIGGRQRLGPTDEIVTQRRPPADRASDNWQILSKTGPNGNILAFDPVKNRIVDTGQQAGPDPGENSLGIGAGLLDDIRAARQMLAAEADDPQPATVENYRAAAIHALESAKLQDPKVRRIAAIWISNIHAGREAAKREGITLGQAEQLERILNVVVPHSLRPILERISPVPKPRVAPPSLNNQQAPAAPPAASQQQGGSLIGSLFTPNNGYNAIRK